MSLNLYKGDWGQAQIMHLLRRSLFGVTPEDYKLFSKLTLSQSLDLLLTKSPAPPPPVNSYNNDMYKDPDVEFGKTWVTAPFGDLEGEADNRRADSVKGWWIGLMLNQERSLSEKMTVFWSNYFGGRMNEMKDARYIYTYAALLRSFALGNFKELVKEITINPGMLVFLNGNSNTASAPNENYARELQELFTVGKGSDSHYTESDVAAAARVLTGWQDDLVAIHSKFTADRHDTSDKTFSAFYNNAIIKGKEGNDGANEVGELITLLFNQQETAKYFCRRLYRWFVYSAINDSAEESIISPLAELLIKGNFEVRPVVRALLESEHFFDAKNIGCQIKNPIDFLIGFSRQLMISFPGSTELYSQNKTWYAVADKLANLAMNLGDPPNVAGWPAYYVEPGYYKIWINSNTLPLRNSITDALCSESGLNTSDKGYIKFDLLKFTAQLPNPKDIDQLIADSIFFLSPYSFDALQKAVLKKILLSGQTEDHYWTEAWDAFIANPKDEVAKNIVLGRLTAYYTYLLQRPECQLI